MTTQELTAIVQKYAKQNGLDSELLLKLIAAESSGDPEAISPVGAQGLMQLMPETAAQYDVTDPFDPDQNVRGGTRHLGELLKFYNGDIRKALAAHNWGRGNLDKGGPWPQETVNFVNRVAGPEPSPTPAPFDPSQVDPTPAPIATPIPRQGPTYEQVTADPNFGKYSPEDQTDILTRLVGPEAAMKHSQASGPMISPATRPMLPNVPSISDAGARVIEWLGLNKPVDALLGKGPDTTFTEKLPIEETLAERPLGEGDVAQVGRGLRDTAMTALAPHMGTGLAVGSASMPLAIRHLLATLGLGSLGAGVGHLAGGAAGEATDYPELGKFGGETLGMFGGGALGAKIAPPAPISDAAKLSGDLASRVMDAIMSKRMKITAPRPDWEGYGVPPEIIEALRVKAGERMDLANRGPVRGPVPLSPEPISEVPPSANRIVKTPQEAAVEGQIMGLIQPQPGGPIVPGTAVGGTPVPPTGGAPVLPGDQTEAQNVIEMIRRSIAEASNAAPPPVPMTPEQEALAAERMKLADRGPVRGVVPVEGAPEETTVSPARPVEPVAEPTRGRVLPVEASPPEPRTVVTPQEAAARPTELNLAPSGAGAVTPEVATGPGRPVAPGQPLTLPGDEVASKDFLQMLQRSIASARNADMAAEAETTKATETPAVTLGGKSVTEYSTEELMAERSAALKQDTTAAASILKIVEPELKRRLAEKSAPESLAASSVSPTESLTSTAPKSAAESLAASSVTTTPETTSTVRIGTRDYKVGDLIEEGPYTGRYLTDIDNGKVAGISKSKPKVVDTATVPAQNKGVGPKEQLYVHIPQYESGVSASDDVLDSIRTKGLIRGQNNPILARTVEEADSFAAPLHSERPVVVFRGKPDLTVGSDISFGKSVPPENIVAIVTPKKGETIAQSLARQQPQEIDTDLSLAEGVPAELSMEAKAVIEQLPEAEREIIHRELERARSTDVLTGLQNKKGWIAMAKTLGPEDHAVVMDMSGFSEINNTHGHKVGDVLLAVVGQKVQKHLGSDTSRFGGDEFGGVIRGKSLEEAQQMVSALEADLNSTFINIRMPNGDIKRIKPLEVHIGLAKDTEAADIASNDHRAKYGSGRRKTDPDPTPGPADSSGLPSTVEGTEGSTGRGRSGDQGELNDSGIAKSKVPRNTSERADQLRAEIKAIRREQSNYIGVSHGSARATKATELFSRRNKLEKELAALEEGDTGISKAEVSPGKAVGVTQPRLIRELGANLYSGDLGQVVVKEGLQNAVDAIKKGTAGNISVKVNTKDKTFEITDNGVGMMPDIIKNQFLDPGGTFKPEGGRGGYGIAKVALLSQAEKIEVRSVAEVPKAVTSKSNMPTFPSEMEPTFTEWLQKQGGAADEDEDYNISILYDDLSKQKWSNFPNEAEVNRKLDEVIKKQLDRNGLEPEDVDDPQWSASIRDVKKEILARLRAGFTNSSAKTESLSFPEWIEEWAKKATPEDPNDDNLEEQGFGFVFDELRSEGWASAPTEAEFNHALTKAFKNLSSAFVDIAELRPEILRMFREKVSSVEKAQKVSPYAHMEGSKLETTLSGDGERWLDTENPMDVNTREVPADTPTGTRVFIKLNEGASVSDWGVRGFLQNFLAKQKLKHKFEIELDGTAIAKPMDYNAETGKYTEKSGTTMLTEKKMPGADVQIWTGKNLRETDYVSVHVLNDGLPQFNVNVNLKGRAKFPTDIEVNVIPKVDTTDPNYPFTPNRQQLRDSVHEYVEDFVSNKLYSEGVRQEQDLYKEALKNKAAIPYTRVSVLETTGRVKPETLKEIAESDIIQRIALLTSQIVRKAAAAIVRSPVHKTQDKGAFAPSTFSTDLGYSGGKWYGVNLDTGRVYGKIDPATGDLTRTGLKQFSILVDSWEIVDLIDPNLGVEDQAEIFGRETWATAVHELMHNKFRQHDEDFSGWLTHWLPHTIKEGSSLIRSFKKEVQSDPEFFTKLREQRKRLYEEYSLATGKDVLGAITVKSQSGDGQHRGRDLEGGTGGGLPERRAGGSAGGVEGEGEQASAGGASTVEKSLEPSIKRAADFRETGNYEVTYKGETHKIFRDPESKWWMLDLDSDLIPPSKGGNYRSRTVGFNKPEAVEKIISLIDKKSDTGIAKSEVPPDKPKAELPQGESVKDRINKFLGIKSKEEKPGMSRREFLGKSTVAAAGMALPGKGLSETVVQTTKSALPIIAEANRVISMVKDFLSDPVKMVSPDNVNIIHELLNDVGRHYDYKTSESTPSLEELLTGIEKQGIEVPENLISELRNANKSLYSMGGTAKEWENLNNWVKNLDNLWSIPKKLQKAGAPKEFIEAVEKDLIPLSKGIYRRDAAAAINKTVKQFYGGYRKFYHMIFDEKGVRPGQESLKAVYDAQHAFNFAGNSYYYDNWRASEQLPEVKKKLLSMLPSPKYAKLPVSDPVRDIAKEFKSAKKEVKAAVKKVQKFLDINTGKPVEGDVQLKKGIFIRQLDAKEFPQREFISQLTGLSDQEAQRLTDLGKRLTSRLDDPNRHTPKEAKEYNDLALRFNNLLNDRGKEKKQWIESNEVPTHELVINGESLFVTRHSDTGISYWTYHPEAAETLGDPGLSKVKFQNRDAMVRVAENILKNQTAKPKEDFDPWNAYLKGMEHDAETPVDPKNPPSKIGEKLESKDKILKPGAELKPNQVFDRLMQKFTVPELKNYFGTLTGDIKTDEGEFEKIDAKIHDVFLKDEQEAWQEFLSFPENVSEKGDENLDVYKLFVKYLKKNPASTLRLKQPTPGAAK